MQRIPLNKYIDGNETQSSLAKKVSLTQGAISKMIRVGRVVFVIDKEDGGIALIEERLIAESTPSAANENGFHDGEANHVQQPCAHS